MAEKEDQDMVGVILIVWMVREALAVGAVAMEVVF